MSKQLTTCPNPACGAAVEPGMRFCGNCRAELPPQDMTDKTPQYTARPEQILENVRLEYNPLPLPTGSHGIIPLRFINKNNQLPITSLNLRMNCKVCGDEEEMTLTRDIRLPAGKGINLNTWDFDIDCRPGEYSFFIQGHFLVNREIPVAFRATGKIRIQDSARDNNRENLTLKIKAEDGNAFDISELPLDDFNNVNIDLTVKDGNAFDLSRLQKIETGKKSVGDQWNPLQLEFSPDITTALEDKLYSEEELSATELPEQQSSIESSASWTVHTKNTPDRTVLVYTGNSFSMGRDGQRADIVTVFLPMTEKNNEKSMGISGLHCSLSFAKNKVFLADDDSLNGTQVQGARVKKPVQLGSNVRLTFGNTLRLDFRKYRDLSLLKEIREMHSSAVTMNEFSTRIGSLKIDDLSQDIPLDCCTLYRCDDFRDQLSYLFLRRYAGIGSSASNALYLDHPTVGKKHARLLLMENGYFLEAVDPGKETWINSTRLFPGCPQHLPFNQETTLQFGEISVRFIAEDTTK